MIKSTYEKLKVDAASKGAGLYKRLIIPESAIYMHCGYESPHNESLFIVEIYESEKGKVAMLPKVQGLKYTTHNLGDESDGYTSIIIAPTSSKFEESFIVLVEDLVRSLEPSENADSLKIISTRLNVWRKFFSPNLIGQLSAEKQRGLWGELCVLRKLLQEISHQAPEIVKSWRGPYDSPQDFIFNDSIALEVKVKSSNENIRIASEYQLDPTEVNQLWLAVVTLARSDDGTSLNSLVDDVRDALVGDPIAFSDMNHALVEYGYLDLHRKYYDFPSYTKNMILYQVEGSFPRIYLNDIREGVGDVTYSITSNSVAGFERELDEFNREVNNLLEGEVRE